MIFFDSNIFIYAEAREEKHYEEAKSLRDLAVTGQIPTCISPQVMSEFFSSATHEGRKGPEKPLFPSVAAELIRKYSESEDITVIYPGPQTIGLMLSLLDAHPVSGARIHDLRIAATMLENGVTEITTYDEHVFAHLPGITVVDPSDLIPTVEPEDDNSNDNSSLP